MKYQRQLFGPESAKVPTRKKMVLCVKVVAAVNSEGVVKRTEDTCRKRYYDIKRHVKSKMAKEAKSARKAGGGQPYIARYLEYEELMRSVIPPEVVSATHVRDSDSPRKNVLEKSSTGCPTVTPITFDDVDAAEAGPSKEVRSSRSWTSVTQQAKKMGQQRKQGLMSRANHSRLPRHEDYRQYVRAPHSKFWTHFQDVNHTPLSLISW
ncbi:uncharacterized protein LOC134957489 [Pseudophryne corroboree]|uniref:uncharacterized protein LOC134957489 n=1 Tax=Pseudophryne corroboree TaxID=495146 RepID=UPI0030818A93